MLTEDQLDIIGNAIAPLFEHLEQEVIRDVARRILKTMKYTRTAELQASALAEMGYSPSRIRHEAMRIIHADPALRKEIAKNTLQYKREVSDLIQRMTNDAYKAGNELIANAGNMSWISDLSVWRSAGKVLTDYSFLRQLIEAFQRRTAGTLENLTGTAGFKTMAGMEALEDLYQKELNKAVVKVSSGAFTTEQAVRDTVHDLAQSGMRTIDFSSGRSMQLDTAAALAVRTGAHQIAGKVCDKNCELTEQNLVFVSTHEGARNVGEGVANHEAWQGKVYYIKDLGIDYSDEARRIGQDAIKDLWEETGYSADGAHESDPLGLYGYNCRHSHYPWFEGVSELPAKQPDPEPVTINGKTYDYYAATQAMRRKERKIRALKREREAMQALPELYSDEDVLAISSKIRKEESDYRMFSRQAGINPDASRLRYEAGTSDLTKTKAWRAQSNQFTDAALGSADDTERPNGYSVKDEYLESAQPGEGILSLEDGYENDADHKEDLFTANWVHSIFGGDIRLLTRRDYECVDSVWRDCAWEYKSCSSASTINRRLRKAGHQLDSILEHEGIVTGGVVLRINGNGMSDEEIIQNVRKFAMERMKRSADIIIWRNEELIDVLRFIK